jgi:hypothetical protein
MSLLAIICRDSKNNANDGEWIGLLIHAMQNADRKRMKFIGLTVADLSGKDFKHIVKALEKM